MMAVRYIIGEKKETHLDRSVGTLHIVALDNILHNKNNITRKVVTPSST